MHKICTRYAQDMHNVCPRYTQDMPKIIRDILKICQRYAQDMPKGSFALSVKYPKRQLSPFIMQSSPVWWLSHDLCDKLGYWFNIYFHLFGPQNSHRKWFARKLIISLQFELHDIQKWILRCSIAEQATSKIDLRLPETLIGKLIARRMIYQKNWCFKNRLRFFYLFVRICHPSR